MTTLNHQPSRTRVRLLLMTVVLAFVSPLVFGEDFGRLFTTPDQRRALDALKLNQTESTVVPAIDVPALTAPPLVTAPNELRFSGYIQRADGTYALWVNGQSALSNRDLPISEAQFLADEQALLSVGQQQALMKPGQIWSLDSNTVREGYYVERTPRVDTSQPEAPGSE